MWWQWGIGRNHWQENSFPTPAPTPSSFKKTLLDALLFSSLWPYGGHDLTPPPPPSNLRNPGKEDAEDNVQSLCPVWPELKVESKNMSYYRTPIVAVSIVIPELITNLPQKKFLELCSPVNCREDTVPFLVWHVVKADLQWSDLELLTVWEWEANALGLSKSESLLDAETVLSYCHKDECPQCRPKTEGNCLSHWAMLLIFRLVILLGKHVCAQRCLPIILLLRFPST